MNENLDLSLTLKDCPKSTKLYCTFLGDVTIQCIKEDRIIIKTDYNSYSLLKDGTFNPEGECVIFPSREQRDWSKFERFWDKLRVEKFDPKTLQPFDRVLCRDSERNTWDADIFSYKTDKEALSYYCIGDAYKYCIPYNEETKHLLGTTDECPEYYKWWEE